MAGSLARRQAEVKMFRRNAEARMFTSGNYSTR